MIEKLYAVTANLLRPTGAMMRMWVSNKHGVTFEPELHQLKIKINILSPLAKKKSPWFFITEKKLHFHTYVVQYPCNAFSPCLKTARKITFMGFNKQKTSRARKQKRLLKRVIKLIPLKQIKLKLPR